MEELKDSRLEGNMITPLAYESKFQRLGSASRSPGSSNDFKYQGIPLFPSQTLDMSLVASSTFLHMLVPPS